MKIVLIFNETIKLYGKEMEYNALIAFIQEEFHLQTPTISLTFLDEQGDQITVQSDEDLQTMLLLFQGKQYVKMNLSGTLSQSQASESKLVKDENMSDKNNQSLFVNQREVSSLQKSVEKDPIVCQLEEKKEHEINSHPQKMEEQNGEEKKEHKGQCEWKKQKWAQIQRYMNQTVAKLVDQRIKFLLPCIKEQLNQKDIPKIQSVVIHEGFQCKSCLMVPITGIRYQCLTCPNFNLCSQCETKIDHDHNMLKVKKIVEKKEESNDEFKFFKKFFKKHHGHHGRFSSSSSSRDRHERKHHFKQMKCCDDLSFLFGGEARDYAQFVQENSDLRGRQMFLKFAQIKKMPLEQFNTKFIEMRCAKFSKCFGKPAQFYKEFVQRNINLGHHELFRRLFEEGLEQKQERKCWRRCYKFNSNEEERFKEKREEKIEQQRPKEVEKQQQPVVRKESQLKKEQSFIIPESALRLPEIDKPEDMKIKSIILTTMMEIFGAEKKKELFQFINEHYAKEKEQEKIIEKWIEKSHLHMK